jgi:ubiquinone/menaquinone biosynthesis C-methylase UbiE
MPIYRERKMKSVNESMRLGGFEFLAMNNPLRRFIQKHVEFNAFKKLLNECHLDLTGRDILDAGCGSGYSSKLISKEFAPSKLTAFDYMPEQISLAEKRNIDADFFVGDLTNIDLPDSSYDAIFIFGVIHHIPRWRGALMETSRVLRPGGVLLVEEPRYRFTWVELEQGIAQAGFRILAMERFFLTYFRSYLCRNEAQ